MLDFNAFYACPLLTGNELTFKVVVLVPARTKNARGGRCLQGVGLRNRAIDKSGATLNGYRLSGGGLQVPSTATRGLS